MNDTESELAAALWVAVIGLIYAATTYVVASQSVLNGLPVAAFGIVVVIGCGVFSRRKLDRERACFPCASTGRWS